MPLPKPWPEEEREAFCGRCVASEVMNQEYPEEKQRWAVCISLWERRAAGKLKKLHE